VTTEPPLVSQFVILADESAHWRIAGLTQLERALLALNEFAASTGSQAEEVSVVIFWKPELSLDRRRQFTDPRLIRIRCTDSLSSARSGAILLSTYLFIERDGISRTLAYLPSIEQPIVQSLESWSELSRNLATRRERHLSYLNVPSDVPACERRFLGGAGKSQDGPVSRFLNRPISRVVTRFLLRFPISPTAWTVGIFLLPLAAFLFFLRGDYSGVLAGALIFQLYSILDGCDGEIARAKYLESARGGRIDDFLDMLGSVLFVVGLGLGLSRWSGFVYRWEGMACAAVILLNEAILRLPRAASTSASGASVERTPQGRVPTQAASLGTALYPRHREMVQNSGLLLLGEKKAWWIIQLTKRDVAVFVFLLLALANLAPWILHLWITVSAVTLALTIRVRFLRLRP
jgi:phosphatidylglycerophosphate synthase